MLKLVVNNTSSADKTSTDIEEYLAVKSDRDLVRATLFLKTRAFVEIRTCFRRGLELSRNQRMKLALGDLMQQQIDNRKFA